MNKPVVFSIFGIAAIGTVIWLAMRANDPGAPAATAAADASAPTALAHPETNSSEAGNRATGATVQAATAADGVAPPAMKRDAASPTESHEAALPIDVSPGFEYLAKPAAEMQDTDSQWTHWRRHQQLQDEPRDDNWAPRMEAEFRRGIQDSLTSAGLDTQRIELSVLECRTHGCEIQAVGYGEDNMKPKADLQSIMFTLLSGPMGDEFDRNGLIISMGPRPDGRILFLVQVPRKKS
jgi:hypothetical protein